MAACVSSPRCMLAALSCAVVHTAIVQSPEHRGSAVFAAAARELTVQIVIDAHATVIADVATEELFPGGPAVLNARTLAELIVSAPVQPLPRILCVVDGRAVLQARPGSGHTRNDTMGTQAWCDAISCGCAVSSAELSLGVHSLAMYAADDDGHSCAIGPSPLFVNLTTSTDAVSGDVRVARSNDFLRSATPANAAAPLGIYYTTYQSVTASAYQNLSALLQRDAYSVEDVVRNDSLRLVDSLYAYIDNPSVVSPSLRDQIADLFQQQPSLGYYCIYSHRSDESSGIIPDCQEATAVLQAQAAEMSAIGMEYVTTDATNCETGGHGNLCDFIQLRPTEVIAEVWSSVRGEGRATPQLGVFSLVSTACSENCLWNWYLAELYNNATYLAQDMVWRDANSSKLVYMIVGRPGVNETAVSLIAANGGLNNIATPINWVADNANPQHFNGTWTYYSPCAVPDATSPTGFSFSTDAYIDANTACGHFKTTNSPVGDAWTVSTGDATANLPFGTPTKANGLHLKKQWWDVFADPAADWLYMPSFNEFVVSPINFTVLKVTNPWFTASGLHWDDEWNDALYGDGWVAERSRTVEPGVSDGGYYFLLTASCLRVYRLQGALGIVGDGLGCSVAGEECCVVHSNQTFSHVWSLTGAWNATAAQAAVTNDASELAALLESGWTQLCAPSKVGNSGWPTVACTNGSLPFAPASDPNAYNAARGPFLMYSNSSGADVPATHPVYRCAAASGARFVSLDAACEQVGHLEFILGYACTSRNGLCARMLKRCGVAASSPPLTYTVLEVPCAGADAEQGVLGYVI